MRWRLAFDFLVAVLRPSWTWLLLVPLAVAGGLQLIRDEFIDDPKIKSITLGQIAEEYFPAWSLETYIAIFLLIVLFITALAATAKYVADVRDLQSRLETKKTERYYEIDRDYSNLAKIQTTFWDRAREAYVAHSGGAATSLDRLIERSSFPKILPFSDDENEDSILLSWINEIDGDDRALWDFVSEIYKPREGGGVISALFKDDDRFDMFHNVRNHLVKFWGRCGELIEDDALSFSRVKQRFYPGQIRLLLFLSFLHLRLAQCLGTRGFGAHGMYKLIHRMLEDDGTR